MKLLRFIFDEARSSSITLLILLFFLGAPFSLIGYIIGDAISGLPGHAASFHLFLAFSVVALIGFWMNGTVVTRMIALVEQISDRLRRRILDRVRAIDLLEFDAIGRANIYFMVSSHTRRISDATVLFGRAVLSIFGTTACLVMLACISGEALAVVALAIVIVGVVFALNQVEIARTHELARQSEQRYFHGMSGLVNGFKELRLHQRKEEAFFQAEIASAGVAAESARSRAGVRLFLNYLLYTVLILISAGVCLHLLPLMFPELSNVAVHAAIIAGLIPLSVLRDLPLLSRAASAVDGLQTLEVQLDAALVKAAPNTARPPAEGFRSIALHDVEFRYTGRDGEVTFPVGPLSFEFPAGTVSFIVGGNGSGKSTVLKLLTGLYPPLRGTVTLNGVPIAMGAQRPLFTTIFGDFQLFDRLYGYRSAPPEQVKGWLEALHLAGRVDYVDGRFTDLRLSTGQRKRLALVASLVEDRPIFAFDEWAADQDPEYREWFYLELLPMLKARGKTVIAVTHDDRYFPVADQLLQMDKGRNVG